MGIGIPAIWRRHLVNGLIIVHLFALFFWGAPDCRFTMLMVRPVAKYVLFTGLWHSWKMFAPSPYTLQYDVHARVTYKDGSQIDWVAPRMEELTIWKQMTKERFRKWRELMFTDSCQASYLPTARYVARRYHRNPRNPPVEVRLIRYWAAIQPPIPGQDYQPIPRNIIRNKSYTYSVSKISEADLR